MKYFKKIISLVILTCTILTLISCGVNNTAQQALMLRQETTAAVMTSNAGFGRANAKMSVVDDIAVEEMAYDGATYNTSSGVNSSDRKIVKTIDLNTETKTFDESVEWLKSYVASFNGIIDNFYVDTGNMNSKNYNKSANFNVRIPAEKLDAFLSKIGDRLNITFRQENISDITEEYSDTESRLNSLKIEEESLNAMLKKAKTVEEMIKVEDKLSSVRTEKENITRRLKRMDKQVIYSSVHISISEVRELTEPRVQEGDYSRETLMKQLNKNFVEVKNYVKQVGAYLFTNIPWIILGLIVMLVLIILYAIFRALFDKKSDDKVKTVSEIFYEEEKQDDKKADKKKSDKNKEKDVEVEFFQDDNEES